MKTLSRSAAACCVARQALILVLVASGGLCAQTSNTEHQFWPKIEAFLNLNQKSRLVFMYSATREDDLSSYADGKTGIYLDVFALPILRRELRKSPDAARSKVLAIRAGYVFSIPEKQTQSSTEHDLILEATGRFLLQRGVHFVDRNRIDLRWIKGVLKSRYRNRLRVERAYAAGKFDLTPYTSAEAFYEMQAGAFQRFRFAGGMDWTINRHMMLDIYYLRQNDSHAAPRYVNALGLTANFHFR